MSGQNFVMHLGFWILVAEVDTCEESAITFYKFCNTKERRISRIVSCTESTLSVSGHGKIIVRQNSLILWYTNTSIVNHYHYDWRRDECRVQD